MTSIVILFLISERARLLSIWATISWLDDEPRGSSSSHAMTVVIPSLLVNKCTCPFVLFLWLALSLSASSLRRGWHHFVLLAQKSYVACVCSASHLFITTSHVVSYCHPGPNVGIPPFKIRRCDVRDVYWFPTTSLGFAVMGRTPSPSAWTLH